MMDRLQGDLGNQADSEEAAGTPAISLHTDEEALVRRSAERLAIPQRLFTLDELDVLYDVDQHALWTFMRPRARPSFTPPMLSDFEEWQSLIAASFGPGKTRIDYLILGSRSPGVFCFGGDLELFARLIRAGNREALTGYGRRCVEILDRNIRALDLPMVTIGLVQGQAYGGGFEALLSFDFIIAEKGATFALPEVKFGLFPGMGAHALLSRKLGAAMAARMILSDQTYTAEQMYEFGLVHLLAEPGEGVAVTQEFINKGSRRHAGMVGACRAMRVSTPVPMAEFYGIVDIWTDSALQLSEKDLRLMERLASAQQKLALAS